HTRSKRDWSSDVCSSDLECLYFSRRMKKGGAVVDQTFEKRKKVMLDFISDDLYVPMKIREIAAVLQIPREQRDDLKAVLDALVEIGRASCRERGEMRVGA